MNASYLLLEEADSTELIKKINAMLVAGWAVQGGISYNPTQKLYLQAMMMYFDDDEIILT